MGGGALKKIIAPSGRRRENASINPLSIYLRCVDVEF
jgi:hypothetical protein